MILKILAKAATVSTLSPTSYEAAYQPVVRDTPIPINERGECVVAIEIPCDHSKPTGSVQKGDVQECDESESIQCSAIRSASL